MRKLFLILILLLGFTGCTANYTINVFDGTIEESLTILEEDQSLLYEKDDMNMSFKDYALEYGNKKDLYTNYYNMYTNGEVDCQSTLDNDCSVYESEYIDNNSIGFKLFSSFSFDEYENSTIANELMPGFTSSFDGRYLTISGSSNWNPFKGYKNLERITININSNYYPVSSNARYKGNGEYEWIITNENNTLDSLYIIFDTTATKRLANKNSWLLAIIFAVILSLSILITLITFFIKRKNNNKI